MKNIINLVIIFALMFSCTPPDVGYISNNIHALEDTVFVPRGVFMTSAAPSNEGSTYPMHWEFKNITDEAGNETQDLFDKHEILIWTASFNPTTDTTLELAKEKLELSEEPSILLNSVSGEMAFTQASKLVEKADIYKVNMLVSNIRGQKELDDYVVIKLGEFLPVEFTVQMRSRLYLNKAAGGKDIGYTGVITGPYDDQIPEVLAGTHPYFRITKVSDEPALGLKWNMHICDSYGNEIPTSEVTFYPSGAGYLQNFHGNSVETVDHGDYFEFNLPAPPMPQYSPNYGGGNSDLMYYLATDKAFIVDTVAYEADNGETDWSIYKDIDTGEVMNYAYIRWGIHINDSGTWKLEMRIPYTKKK